MNRSKNLSRTAKITFQRKLLTGFTLVALIVGVMLFISNSMLHEASRRLSEVHESRVQPLVEVNNLQSKTTRIRMIETQLPLMKDYFALSSEAQRLKQAVSDFHQHLTVFGQRIADHYPNEIKALNLNWGHLQKYLLQIVEMANQMRHQEISRISTYEASPRFEQLSKNLEQLSQGIEAMSEKSYQEAQASLERKRQHYMGVSLVALLLGMGLLLYFSRSLSQRVTYLAHAFTRVAEGKLSERIRVEGNDELGDLAKAFERMREQVQSRERQLRNARQELEERVHQRTRDLHETNRQLTSEIDERRRVEQDLKILTQAVAQSPVSVIITDQDGNIEYVNGAFEQQSGYTFAEVQGQNPRMLASGQTPSSEYRQLWRTIMAGDEWQGELCNRKKNGQLHWELTHISPVKDEAGRVTHFLALKQDITERKAQEQKILYQAHYDALTDLPNRALAMDRLQQTIAQSRRNSTKAMLLFIDLDGFKHINDSLGHDVGDALLIQAAKRLKGAVRGVDTVARHGGDEFLVIMGGLAQREDVGPVVSNLLDAFSDPFKIAGNDLVVTPSIGLALYPDDGEDSQMLLRNADMAMYQAKDNGRNTFCFYSQEIHDNLNRRVQLENHLRWALARKEMELVYQPIMETRQGRLVGVEALLRWQNPVLGRVEPEQFIAVAEQSGLIIEIGRWMIQRACRQLKAWQDQGFEHLQLSLNITPRQIQSEDLGAVISDSLAQNGLEPGCLSLEITEGILVRNPAEAQRILADLKALGVKLAMDDFGTGYSSLSNLKSYPFDIIKIDREFIQDLGTEPADRALVLAAISMGQGLGLTTVAEGVENEQQRRLLAEMGCDCLQGYLLGEPVRAELFEDWLNIHQQRRVPSV